MGWWNCVIVRIERSRRDATPHKPCIYDKYAWNESRQLAIKCRKVARDMMMMCVCVCCIRFDSQRLWCEFIIKINIYMYTHSLGIAQFGRIVAAGREYAILYSMVECAHRADLIGWSAVGRYIWSARLLCVRDRPKSIGFGYILDCNSHTHTQCIQRYVM